MNANLNALRIALLQCFASPDVSADEITEVIRETARTEMDEGTKRTQKCRTILEKLRIPYHYTTCPDYLSNPVGAGRSESESVSFTNNGAFGSDGYFVQAAQMTYPYNDGILGAAGEDSIALG